MLQRLILFAALLLVPAIAPAQQAFRPGVNVQDSNPQPVKLRCWNSTTLAFEDCVLNAGGSASPTGAAGSPNANVVSVQGVPNGSTVNTLARGGANIATGQIVVGTTATQIVAARTLRQKVGVTVTTAVQCAFGNAGVTLATGWPLAAVAYASDNWDTAGALFGVCASSATVGYREQY